MQLNNWPNNDHHSLHQCNTTNGCQLFSAIFISILHKLTKKVLSLTVSVTVVHRNWSWTMCNIKNTDQTGLSSVAVSSSAHRCCFPVYTYWTCHGSGVRMDRFAANGCRMVDGGSSTWIRVVIDSGFSDWLHSDSVWRCRWLDWLNSIPTFFDWLHLSLDVDTNVNYRNYDSIHSSQNWLQILLNHSCFI